MSEQNQWRSELHKTPRSFGEENGLFSVTVEPTVHKSLEAERENTVHAVSVKHTPDTDVVRLKLASDGPMYISTDEKHKFSFLGVHFKGQVIGTGVMDGHTVIDIEPSDVRPPDGGWP